MKKWYALSLSKIFKELGSSEYGLSQEKAQKAYEKFGPNKLIEKPKPPWYISFLEQFKSLPIILLLIAALISFVLGITIDSHKLIDAFAILVAVFIAAFFGFWQEFKAEKALEALKKMIVQKSIVIREGKEFSIDSSELVPGDIIILEEGSNVPADIRLINAINLLVDESVLTGESLPVEKKEGIIPKAKSLTQQYNMIFAGTTIVKGHCKGIVVETGMNTEFGKIVSKVSDVEEKETRLQRDISELSKKLGYAGISLAFLFFIIGILNQHPITEMFVVAVTLAVAVIPEGLPTVLAITLALGVQKMAKENAIIRKLTSVETLGSATVICTDKTGTITQNKIQVKEIILPDKIYSLSDNFTSKEPSFIKAVEIMALCNNALRIEEKENEEKEKIIGDPTEVALLEAVNKIGVDERQLRLKYKQIGEVPFDSERKMMSSVRMFGSVPIALVKGAPEKIISRSKKILIKDKEIKLSEKMTREILYQVQKFGENGMRLLALAYRKVPKRQKYTSSNTENSLVFVGLVAMEDPIRPEVPQAIALCKSAGLKVIMITGDSIHTAKAIATKAGILEPGFICLDGNELDTFSDKELEKIIPKVRVFARVNPEQKYRIVNTLMKLGEVVAVTGDGVNDAPALKKADIGIAMGITGTDVSKEVSDMILTDDNFASIVSAIKYGRAIFDNIKSFVRYQISTNVAALTLMFSAPVLNLPLPLNPIQILWINIMVDGPPALALGVEPPSGDVMKRPPRNPKISFVTQNLIVSILVIGVLMAFIAIALFGFYLFYNPDKANSAVFTLFVFLQLFNALNCRSNTKSIFSNFFSNKSIFFAIMFSLIIHLSIIYIPFLQSIFKTVPLEMEDFSLIIPTAFAIIVFEEIRKKFLPKTTNY